MCIIFFAVFFFFCVPKIKSITNINVDGATIIPFFDKYTKRYNLFLDEITEFIYINVTKEKNDDYVEGIGKITLSSGINILNIIVHKTDKSQERYSLVVHNGKIIEESNSFLLDINIEGYDILFNKEVLNYEINIEGENELKVSYTPSNEKQIIKMEGNNNLKSGKNEIKITVSYEEDKTIYIIKVNKLSSVFNEERKEKYKTIFNKESLNKKEKIVIIISISSICFVLILLIFYILFCVKKKSNLQHV